VERCFIDRVVEIVTDNQVRRTPGLIIGPRGVPRNVSQVISFLCPEQQWLCENLLLEVGIQVYDKKTMGGNVRIRGIIDSSNAPRRFLAAIGALQCRKRAETCPRPAPAPSQDRVRTAWQRSCPALQVRQGDCSAEVRLAAPREAQCDRRLVIELLVLGLVLVADAGHVVDLGVGDLALIAVVVGVRGLRTGRAQVSQSQRAQAEQHASCRHNKHASEHASPGA